MILIFLLPLFLFQACGPMPGQETYVIENRNYDSPLKPCAYEYPDLNGNLCVVEINDKNVLPKIPDMNSNQMLIEFSRMAAAKQCERSGGKKIGEEIIGDTIIQICFHPREYKQADCYKGTLTWIYEGRIICLCYLVPSVENPSNEMIKSKLLAMKDTLKSNMEYYKASGGKMAPHIPGRELKDAEGNICVIESRDEHFYPRPPTSTREEYVAYLLNLLADIQCKQKPGSKKLHSEMTEEGYFMALELPKGMNNKEDCTKGVLSFYEGNYIYHICYLVPAEKKTNVEMLKTKLAELKREALQDKT